MIFDSMKSFSIYSHSCRPTLFVSLKRQFYFHSCQLILCVLDSCLSSPISSLACLCWSSCPTTTTASIWLSMCPMTFSNCSMAAAAAAAEPGHSPPEYQMTLHSDRCSNSNSNHCVRCVPTKIHCLNLFASISASWTTDPISRLWTASIYRAWSALSAWPACRSLRCCHCRLCDCVPHTDSLVSCTRFAVANLIFFVFRRQRMNREKKEKERKWETKKYSTLKRL